MDSLTANASILINVPAIKVWEGLTSPDLIRQYFFGTEAVSDWKVGSPLLFKGVWEGKEYLDKGTILRSEAPYLFSYDYRSSFSEQPDIPESYAVITYGLTEAAGLTTLYVTQTNCSSEAAKTHSEKNWMTVLEGLKTLLEK